MCLKKFVVVMSVVLAMAGIASGAARAPIHIGSVEELQRIGHDAAYPLNGYYVLTNDIDASHTAQWHDGAGFAPIGQRLEDDDSRAFNGWFDGQGYRIHGLVINRPDEKGVGLFGSIGKAAVVVNLILEDVTVTGNDYVGSLTGENWSVEVAACFASATVSGRSRVGAFIGINRGLIEACEADGEVRGELYVGGLVGRNYRGTVLDCYAEAAVSGGSWVGGLVGQTVNGAVYDSAWDITRSGITVSDGGVGVIAD